MCVPRTLPHCPIAMYNGIPVAFLVSEPRLCATIVLLSGALHVSSLKSLTPGNDHTDDGIGTARNAESSKVPDVLIICDGQEEEVAYAPECTGHSHAKTSTL